MKTLIIFLLLTILSTVTWAQPWPQTPPRIGRLKLKQEYWEYIKEAAERNQISPYLIQAVCAIESRYDPNAKSGQCYGLMQLHKATARKYGVDSHDPRENIMGGAAVLARLMNKYHNNIRRVLHVYNASCTPAYVREVLKAYRQARSVETSSSEQTPSVKASSLKQARSVKAPSLKKARPLASFSLPVGKYPHLARRFPHLQVSDASYNWQFFPFL